MVDADLKSYFDTIPYDKLLLSVRTRVIDRPVMKLIEMWLKAGVMGEVDQKNSDTGTPQRGVISPLLANLYLHWLDHSCEKQGLNQRWHDAHLVCYADNFVILCRKQPNF
ncbi:reverse transcriptase domain-containing protein [Serratia symbiotica]|uniref:reverse transcriptase domain-containing protein n=1 Tax=Serratia symbiotica TaxID=138074 RepID=UPI003EBCFBD4